MDTTISQMLDEEYKRTLEEVARIVTSSEEAKWQLMKLAELHKQRLEEDKAVKDDQIRTRELELKEAQIKENRTDLIIHVIADGITFIGSLGSTCYWMSKGLHFEETGTFTSRVGKWVGEHFRLFKK